MPKLSLRSLLFLGAYSPLFATLYVLLGQRGELPSALVALALAGVGLGATTAYLLSIRPVGVALLQVDDVLDRCDDFGEYFTTWALPLLAVVVPFDSGTRALVLLGLLAALGVLYPLRGRPPVNPLLALAGRRLLVVSESEGQPQLLLASHTVQRGDLLRVTVASGGLLVAAGIATPPAEAPQPRQAAAVVSTVRPPAPLLEERPATPSRPAPKQRAA